MDILSLVLRRQGKFEEADRMYPGYSKSRAVKRGEQEEEGDEEDENTKPFGAKDESGREDWPVPPRLSQDPSSTTLNVLLRPLLFDIRFSPEPQPPSCLPGVRTRARERN